MVVVLVVVAGSTALVGEPSLSSRFDAARFNRAMALSLVALLGARCSGDDEEDDDDEASAPTCPESLRLTGGPCCCRDGRCDDSAAGEDAICWS